MADEKTSQLADAATLAGTELIGIVQSGANVKATSYNVSNFVNTRPFVQMGEKAHAHSNENAIAVGYYAEAYGSNTIAIGCGAYGDSPGAISVGYNSSTNSQGGIAIGSFASGNGPYAIAVGGRAHANGTYAIALGYHTNAEGNCIAIGAYARAYYNQSIAIGGNAFAFGERSLAIGYNSEARNTWAVAIGRNSYANSKSVAVGMASRSASECSVTIGAQSECLAAYSIAIGIYTYTSAISAIAVGPYCNAQAPKSIALGAYASARSNYSVAIGAHAETHGTGSFALGAFSGTAQDHSMVIGSSSIDIVVGSFVIGGYPVDFNLHPCEHYQKFIGQTVPATPATVTIGSDGFSFTVSYTAGAAGNSYTFQTQNVGANHTLSVSFADGVLTLALGTDGGGDLDPSQNTLANFASLFPADGFTFSFTGPSDSVFDNASTSAPFSGGVDGTPSVVLTADGNSPTEFNVPAIGNSAIATLTGRVTAAGADIFSGSDDAACFVLAPLLLYRGADNVYSFVTAPTFTLENNTAGAADWDVPTLILNEDTGFLNIVVVNNTETLNWMAHFKFETSQ